MEGGALPAGDRHPAVRSFRSGSAVGIAWDHRVGRSPGLPDLARASRARDPAAQRSRGRLDPRVLRRHPAARILAQCPAVRFSLPEAPGQGELDPLCRLCGRSLGLLLRSVRSASSPALSARMAVERAFVAFSSLCWKARARLTDAWLAPITL